MKQRPTKTRTPGTAIEQTQRPPEPRRRAAARGVDVALRRHQQSLHSVFCVYARANRNLSDVLQDSALMSIGEWLGLVEHLGLLETTKKLMTSTEPHVVVRS